MALRNTEQKFGSLTKCFHWTVFLLFVEQYVVEYWRHTLSNQNPLKMQLLSLHNSIGILLFCLVVVMLLWRSVDAHPSALKETPLFERLAATGMQLALYVMMLLLPLTGILIYFFAGKPIEFFGLAMPMSIEIDLAKSNLFRSMHEYLSYLTLFLVSMHVSAAIFHHYIRKDVVLKRMLPGKLS